MIPNRQHMEQMTAGMTSYFLSISKLQASTSAIPVPALSVLSPLGSAILGEGGQLTKQGENTPAALSQVHLSRSDGWKRADDVIRAQVDAAATSNTSSDPLPLTLATPPTRPSRGQLRWAKSQCCSISQRIWQQLESLDLGSLCLVIPVVLFL